MKGRRESKTKTVRGGRMGEMRTVDLIKENCNDVFSVKIIGKLSSSETLRI